MKSIVLIIFRPFDHSSTPNACEETQTSNTMRKFTDDTASVGVISHGDDAADR